MSLSKSLRFEVLRRDGFACTYCGRTPPDVELHVDHVIPTALGGPQTPDNLRTACGDCNTGKGSTPPDADLVAKVANDAARWAAAIEQAASEAQESIRDGDWFLDLWQSAGLQQARRLPADAHLTVAKMEARGLPRAVIEEMFWVAVTGPAPASSQYRYFLGCCNNRLRELHERAAQIVESAEE